MLKNFKNELIKPFTILTNKISEDEVQKTAEIILLFKKGNKHHYTWIVYLSSTT